MKCRAGSIAILIALVSMSAATLSHAEKAFLAGAYVTGGFPLGDWGKIAGFGLGIDNTDVLVPDINKPLRLRGSTGLHYNFSRTESVPQANMGPNDQLELETKNWSLFFGLGPEFGKTEGDVRPFVFGTIGADTYWTSSTLSGTVGGLPYSAKHGDSRIGFAWSAGLGVRRSLAEGVMGELSAEYRSGSGHRFLLPDEVTTSGTAVNASRDSHTTNQIIIRFGTLLGS
jgi:hypothetical protein